MSDQNGTIGWLVPAISFLGAVASWLAFTVSLWQRRKADRLAVEREYAQLAVARETFWAALRGAYTRFREQHVGIPENLDALVSASGTPPNLPLPSGRHLRTWATENERNLGPDQRVIWEFASAVYPARNGRGGTVTDYSIVDLATAVAFHQARGDLARFWNAWVPAIGLSWMTKRYHAARLQTMMLSWLECALVLWTQDDGEGKKNLFEIAVKLMKS
jgi:hypothetical protein